MSVLLMFLAAVCVLTPLVALHEWGHYIVARLCGVKVLTFSIGMGPRVFGWTSKKTGIDYRLSLLPLGGYVKMLDEREGEVCPNERHLAFNNQHPLKKIAIVAAGPVMNFIIAISLFFVLFLMPSEQLNTRVGKVLAPAIQSGLVVGDKIVAIDGKSVNDWQAINYALAGRIGESGQVHIQAVKSEHLVHGDNPPNAPVVSYFVDIHHFMQADKVEQSTQDVLSGIGILPWQPVIQPIIGDVSPDGAAALMGLKTGDIVIKIDNKPIDTWQDAISIIRQNPEKMLNFEIKRDGVPMQIKVMPQAKKIDGHIVGQIGVMVAHRGEIVVPDDYKMSVSHTPAQAMYAAMTRTYDLSVMTLISIGKMLSGLIGLENLSGPIAIADVSKQSFEMGWQQVLMTAALISLSLAVLNLLPIPVLDGGHILYALYELVVGKPLSDGVQMVGLNIGMLLLLSFMLIAIGNDISRFFG